MRRFVAGLCLSVSVFATPAFAERTAEDTCVPVGQLVALSFATNQKGLNFFEHRSATEKLRKEAYEHIQDDSDIWHFAMTYEREARKADKIAYHRVRDEAAKWGWSAYQECMQFFN